MANDTVITGTYGKIRGVGDVVVANITKWSLDRAAAIAKYQSSESAGWRKAVAGGKNWSATFEALLVADGEFNIEEGMYIPDLELGIDAGSSNHFTGNCYVESIADNVDVDGDAIVGFTATVQGDGPIVGAGACAVSEDLSSS